MADKIYKTYDRFLKAAKKFPRWNNTRRRPTTSNGGKLLYAIIEEIGKIEDAIIDYKKDFFIVNYLDKTEDIIDYLYTGQIGNIEDVEKLKLIDPDLKITTETKEFYNNIENMAYYENGFIIVKNKKSSIKYSYNDFVYSVKAEKYHMWNIFDEFAWWAGIERFKDENNKSLMIRTINQFRNRPSSSEEGIKKIIYNTVSGHSNIEYKDIKIDKLNNDNLYTEDNNGETIYENFSRFNKDIARTKQWDIDYWSNKFRETKNLPHQWDAEVKKYCDGVGYNDSLAVSAINDLDINNETDVEITGYKKSTAKIDEYIKNNNINKNISLTLKKYDNTIKPINIQYKIEASPLTEIKSPDKFFVDSYQTSKKEIEYSIDSLYESKESIKITPRNKLEPDKRYALKILPKEDKYSTMEISKCILKHGNGEVNLLKEKGMFGYDSNSGLFVNKGVLLHIDSVRELNSSTNLEDFRYGGFTLIDNGIEAVCEIDVTGIAENKGQPLSVFSTCDLYDITNNPSYIKAHGFVLSNGSFTSSDNVTDLNTLTVELKCKDLAFNIEKIGSSLSTKYFSIETYINGKLDYNHSYHNVVAGKFKEYKLEQFKLNNVRVVISGSSIKISDIKTSRYEISITTSDNKDISQNKKETVTLPQHNGQYFISLSIKNYGQTKPVIKCIHVGSNLNILTSVYEAEIDTTGLTNPELIIEDNCRNDVYLKENLKEPIDFDIKQLYSNTTTEYQAIFLNLDNFKEIYYSFPKIEYTSNNKPYISIKPGDSIDAITIYGYNEVFRSRNNLKNIFSLDVGEKLFTNKEKESFLKKSSTSEELIKLEYRQCSSKKANTYKIIVPEKDFDVCFVSNSIKNAKTISDKYEGIFEYIYIYKKDSQKYIAYNSQNIIKNITTDIEIIKNFAPVLPSNLNFLFIISDIRTRSTEVTTVSFNNNTDWTSNINSKITIRTTINLSNSDTFNATIKQIEQNFILSNNIPLEDRYIINDESIELAKYIIEPPENMRIIYDDITIFQTSDEDSNIMYVEEDGFNKLLYSNIKSIEKVTINNKTVPASDYSLLEEEGIICWNNDSHTGDTFKIVYTYRKPKYMTFSNIEYLYDIVGYKIDTLEKVDMVNDYIIKHVKNGFNFFVDYNYFTEKPDKLLIKCKNPCYTGIIKDNSITIQKIAEDNSIVIHNGYYYIDGKEYWYFSDKHLQDGERLNGVIMVNVEKKGGVFLLRAEANNYLKNSKMLCNTMNIHCMNNFNRYDQVPSISSLEEIGSCDSFSSWFGHDMKITINNTYDGNTLNFLAENKTAYALLDITKAIKRKPFLSCWIDNKLDICIGREILISDQQVLKTTYVEKYKDMESYNDKLFYDCRNLNTDQYRYYLVVTGSGNLIEIMTTDDIDIVQADANYIKAIDKIGLDIEEEDVEETEIKIPFDINYNKLEDLEISKDGLIKPGTNIDWGITRIADIDLASVKKKGFLLRNDSLVSQENMAEIETELIRLDFKKAIKNVFVKINDFPYQDLKDFDISISGMNSYNGEQKIVYEASNKNLASCTGSNIPTYIKINIKAREGKIINHLEVLVQYREGEETPSVSNKTYGICYTKIYDLGKEDRYILKEIETKSKRGEIRYRIRGLKISETNENVWTKWYNLEELHMFDGYRFFQMMITLNNGQDKVNIKNLVFERKKNV